ncbi:hypothetical protein D1159_13420 [Pseudoflavonifractor sp. 524-17]|uniref:hypothetical protein n=1 Tax=Pseudoflavonifractor sp. 524-17 TaxID=2304577 RepID=UPI00137AA2D0|nr:hypothetical protein [Pseudoflavonifractor sp. 524-17]NCE65552.1 hypothetical protein [Pseudoflavonifractor sp. 524-17]
MIELPMSTFMRNYYREQGITFTDSQQATIIWNSDLPMPEILDALREIASTTTDEMLKEQIRERLAAEAENERIFLENDGSYFFIFIPDDEDEWGSRYFSTLDAAIAYGKDHSKETFQIRKESFTDKFDGSAANNDSDKMYVGGQAQYTKGGVLLECACYTEETSINFSHPYQSRFEDAYIPLQNPFELGDIVKIAGDSRPAIVEVSQEDWKSALERNTNGSREIPPATTTSASQLNFLTAGKCIMGIHLFCGWKKSTSGMTSWNGMCFRRQADL